MPQEKNQRLSLCVALALIVMGWELPDFSCLLPRNVADDAITSPCQGRYEDYP